ncbi:MAG TPA: gfo/Idh/MocA family oxidoreductase [Gemmatimonas aurantiaca]|uniref:Gfo/Idh/MocA family oxidoreductase n=2 Tax=Gemmatimonas aurantiaca TaxID=173480 RepID=A0A3D4VC96_9BACT|nr:Gfo/Idh/MocA family oxidoreductase [Gemmatimonas aurantiaca]BAH39526.1 putative oxidoreductase [Gemmatimonas aurantiaca T-27]HCT58464.1 gfo/Idh/MocA family oxidoreductase [Gemmatimonas aurantiaca]
MHDDGKVSRRALLGGAAAAAATAMVGAPMRLLASTDDWRVDLAPPVPSTNGAMLGVPFEKHAVVRIAIVGTGLRGRSVLNEWLAVEGVEITALADVVPEKAQRAADMVTKAGRKAPALFTAGERDFERLVQRDDIDFVYTATPWQWHTPVMLAALAAGKHCASEVPIAMSVEDCWRLVEASEKAKRHCLMMENCCYGNSELSVLRMVREGVFGTLLHAEAAYLHDLRKILFEDRDEGLWRRAPHTQRDANFYPTHGLGPVAQYLGIHRGDRFDYMVSMSSNEAGLTEWREQHEPKGSAKWAERYKAGDMNSSLIRTAKGRTILLQHDVVNPRPYSRLNNLQGSKAIFNDYPPRLYIDGAAGGERWTPLTAVQARYEHPLWTAVGEKARQGGHGGMDFVMAYRLVQCMREGLAPDFDVYDAVAWSVPFALSEQSMRKGSAPVKFPDFTRGAWRTSTAPQGPGTAP